METRERESSPIFCVLPPTFALEQLGETTPATQLLLVVSVGDPFPSLRFRVVRHVARTIYTLDVPYSSNVVQEMSNADST